MKKVLLVQRTLTHYRRLLLDYIELQGEYAVDVVSIGHEEGCNEKVRTYTARTLLQYKNYKIQRSPGMINYVKTHYQEYDYIILEGATNLSNNIPIVKFLKSKHKPYLVWDAGRRKNSKMSLPRKLAQGRLEYVWKNSAAIIAYSTLAKSYFKSIGIADEHIFVCQNTLYVGEFDKQIEKIDPQIVKEIRSKYVAEGEKIILYVGAVEPRKRIKDLIDAFELIQKTHTGAALVIIGGGNQLEELREYAKDKQKVYLLGQIIDGVIKYFMACDVFALPSEGGLSLNQAMICRKPLVASSADGTELDLIEDGKNGYIFEEGDVSGLAEKIIRIITTPGLSESMGAYSRTIIDQRVNEVSFYHNFKSCLGSVDK